MSYKYELVKKGDKPTWDNTLLTEFQNPVHIGDKVKSNAMGSDLVRAVEIEHYPTRSVIYY